MAKTTRRPVDKLERKQRLEQRNRFNNGDTFIFNGGTRLVLEDHFEDLFENMDKTQAA